VHEGQSSPPYYRPSSPTYEAVNSSTDLVVNDVQPNQSRTPYSGNLNNYTDSSIKKLLDCARQRFQKSNFPLFEVGEFPMIQEDIAIPWDSEEGLEPNSAKFNNRMDSTRLVITEGRSIELTLPWAELTNQWSNLLSSNLSTGIIIRLFTV
jgi:hypothetical protein